MAFSKFIYTVACAPIEILFSGKEKNQRQKEFMDDEGAYV